MEQWHYDPAAELGPETRETLRHLLREPGPLVRGARALTAVALRAWLNAYHRLTIVGRENLPVGRSFVMVANHSSHLDTPCLLSALPLRRLHQAFPAAAKDYFCVNAVRTFLARVVVNALPFERYLAPWQSLSVCAHLLERPGSVLIFFPEGTRSDGGAVGEFKPGVALLAAGRDVPVVPCHLAGTGVALPRGASFPWPGAVRLTIGAPRVYPHLPATKESAKQISRELREAVMELGREEAGV